MGRPRERKRELGAVRNQIGHFERGTYPPIIGDTDSVRVRSYYPRYRKRPGATRMELRSDPRRVSLWPQPNHNQITLGVAHGTATDVGVLLILLIGGCNAIMYDAMKI